MCFLISKTENKPVIGQADLIYITEQKIAEKQRLASS